MKRKNPQEQWKTILEATTSFKDAGEVKGRFNVIKHHLDNDNTKSDGNAGKKKNNKGDDNPNREEINRRNKEEGQRKKAEKQAAREAQEKQAAGEVMKEDAKKVKFPEGHSIYSN